MALAIREQILAALATRLAGIAGVGSFARNRDDDLPPGALPALVLIDGGQSRQDDLVGAMQYELRVTVGLYAAGAGIDGAAAGAALTEIYAKTVETVALDPTLGGLASWVTERNLSDPVMVSEDGVAPFMAADLEFLIVFETAEADPRVLGP